MCEQACQPESRRSPTPEIFNGSYAAKTPPRTPGQKATVVVAFQFQLVGRPYNQVNDRYSASNLRSSLPQAGQLRP